MILIQPAYKVTPTFHLKHPINSFTYSKIHTQLHEHYAFYAEDFPPLHTKLSHPIKPTASREAETWRGQLHEGMCTLSGHMRAQVPHNSSLAPSFCFTIRTSSFRCSLSDSFFRRSQRCRFSVYGTKNNEQTCVSAILIFSIFVLQTWLAFRTLCLPSLTPLLKNQPNKKPTTSTDN